MFAFIVSDVPLGPSDDVFFTGAMMAALFGALASLLGLVISKESKVSEFRQKWIDELRKDTAAVMNLAGAYAGNRLSGGTPVATEKINRRLGMIRLRLNLQEKDHEELFESLKGLRDRAVGLQPTQNPAALLTAQTAFGNAVAVTSDIAAKVLKREWNVVKRGERVYKTALALVVLALVSLAYTAVVHYFHHTIFMKPY
jgi:hypothetical protein